MAKRATTRRQTASSNTYRFFVSSAAVRGDDVQIEDVELAHQLSSVLRLGAGDTIVLLDNDGLQHTVILNQVSRGHVAGTRVHTHQAGGEPRTTLVLYVALMRSEKFELVLQKGTELGVHTFVPLITERSMTDAGDVSVRKTERWNKIIREAAEQSRRGRLPQLAAALPFAEACAHATQCGTAMLLWEGTGAQPLRQVLQRLSTSGEHPVTFLTGPEGGFAEHELALARSHGIIPATLGPRTLRAETAPLVAAAATFYELGDLD